MFFMLLFCLVCVILNDIKKNCNVYCMILCYLKNEVMILSFMILVKCVYVCYKGVLNM